MPNTQVFFYFLIFLEQCNYFDVFKDKANITLSQSFFFFYHFTLILL